MSCRVVNDTKIIGILNFMIEVVEKNHTLAVHLYIYIIGIVWPKKFPNEEKYPLF